MKLIAQYPSTNIPAKTLSEGGLQELQEELTVLQLSPRVQSAKREDFSLNTVQRIGRKLVKVKYSIID